MIVTTEKLAEWLAASAYCAYRNARGDTQEGRDYLERCTHPELGDLVLEVSSLGMGRTLQRIGYLISVEKEPFEDWDDIGGGPAPTRDVWTIDALDGERSRWENCRFIVIPKDDYDNPMSYVTRHRREVRARQIAAEDAAGQVQREVMDKWRTAVELREKGMT